MEFVLVLGGLLAGVIIGYFIGSGDDGKVQQQINNLASEFHAEIEVIKQSVNKES